MLYPLTFRPIFKERVWGGRQLEKLYQKPLPPAKRIGESWEISDRPGDISVIANGPLAGHDLRWLMEQHRAELLGSAQPANGRFPLLIKWLDAREKLSLQVHPAAATRFGGELKTELWLIAESTAEGELFAGLKRGVTRDDFERKIHEGTVAECFHCLHVKPGDAMFVPSGRVHGIGAGNVVMEIQQNSDTTYRVFDWNRMGLDGRPRELHVAESLAAIDFNDFEPSLVAGGFSGGGPVAVRHLVAGPPFRADLLEIGRGARLPLHQPVPVIIGVVKGRLKISHREHELPLTDGQFVLIPAGLEPVHLTAETQVSLVQTEPG